MTVFLACGGYRIRSLYPVISTLRADHPFRCGVWQRPGCGDDCMASAYTWGPGYGGRSPSYSYQNWFPRMPLPGGYVPPGAQQGGTPILTVGGYPTVIVSGESGSKPNGDIEPLIIDVRSVREFRAEHVPGAQSIPIDELEDRMAEVALATKGNWNAPIWIYCRHGELAAQAQEYLASLGFTQVRNLGGLEDHQNSGRSGRAENPAWPWVVGASAAAVAVLAKVVCDPGGITGAGGGGTSLQKEMHRPYGAELRYLGRFCHFRRPYEVTTFGPHPSVSNEYGQPVSMAVQRQTFPTLAAATEYFNAEAAKAREAAPP